MNWMACWPGRFPVYAAEASGAHVTDVDGHEYIDFCLGDTGAMTGHSPAATVAVIAEQARRGISLMLPTEDSPSWVRSWPDGSGSRSGRSRRARRMRTAPRCASPVRRPTARRSSCSTGAITARSTRRW